MENDILKNLNDAQKEAVLYNNGPLLILAGAGTGKTKVITSKIAYILNENLAFPSQILAVTFTNKAAREMKDRVDKLLNTPVYMSIGTFHSICLKILKNHAQCVGLRSDFEILDDEDQESMITTILKELNIEIKEKYLYISKISYWKNKGILPEDVKYNDNYNSLEIYKIYRDRCFNINKCDFDDLLLFNIQIFKKNPEILEEYIEKYKYILVDEYQDTNSIQNQWLKMISGLKKKEKINITCVGDDDQSIYGWRGSEIKNILNFEKDFKDTKIIKLERNYRSTQNILDVAYSIISNNKDRHEKKLWTISDNVGESVKLNYFDNSRNEAYHISHKIKELIDIGVEYQNIAVLIRSTYQSRDIEKSFKNWDIPYEIIGGVGFYQRSEIKDCIAILKFLNHRNDWLAFQRIIENTGIGHGIGATTIERIIDRCKTKEYDILEECRQLFLIGAISGKKAEVVANMIDYLQKYSDELIKKNNPAEIIEKIFFDKETIFKDTTIYDYFKRKNDETYDGKELNVKEFINKDLANINNLSDFLENISLESSKKNNNIDKNSVKIITIHSAKGLEFDSVFLAGWNEDAFPSKKSVEEGKIEEERRLAYVGITRAKKFLEISCSRENNKNPSIFIDELPKQKLQIYNETSLNNEEEREYKSNNKKSYNAYNNNHYTKNYDNTYNDNYNNYNYNNYNNNYYTNKYKQSTYKTKKNLIKIIHPMFGEGLVLEEKDDMYKIRFSDTIKTIKKDFVKIVE